MQSTLSSAISKNKGPKWHALRPYPQTSGVVEHFNAIPAGSLHLPHPHFRREARRLCRVAPACGDEFLNIGLLRTKKMLRNAYIKVNRWVTCLYRY
jgi:hypothetical protein